MNKEGKMQIEYNRSGGSNYMILEGCEGLLPYEEKMLSENMIPALLNFHIVKVNARLCYWYDITGLKSLKSIVEREGLGVGNVNQMLRAIDAAYRTLSEYLITEEKVLVSPETVFFKNTGNGTEAALCFLPGAEGEGKRPMLALTEYLIGVVDHEKEDVTKLCYALYEEAAKDGTGTSELLRVLEGARLEPKGGMELMAESGTRQVSDGGMAQVKGSGPHRESFGGMEPEPGGKMIRESENRKAGGFFHKKEREEDFWTDNAAEVTMDDVFADDREEEGEPTIAERLGLFFKSIPDRLFGGFRKKKEEIFPPKDLEEDLVYDPHADYSEPTVLLTADKDACFGKLIYEGTEKEADYMIETDDFHIGSSMKGNEAVLRSPVVSHHHARIIRQDDDYYIEDLNSTNGTFLNGEAITLGQRYKLKYMDKLHFANVPYRIV